MPVNSNTAGTAKVASGANLLAGFWLVVAPWILAYPMVRAIWNDVIVGVVVFVVACIRLYKPTQWARLSWVNFLLGAWLVAAPFILSYDQEFLPATQGLNTAFWNDIIIGLIIILLAALSIDSSNNEFS